MPGDGCARMDRSRAGLWAAALSLFVFIAPQMTYGGIVGYGRLAAFGLLIGLVLAWPVAARQGKVAKALLAAGALVVWAGHSVTRVATKILAGDSFDFEQLMTAFHLTAWAGPIYVAGAALALFALAPPPSRALLGGGTLVAALGALLASGELAWGWNVGGDAVASAVASVGYALVGLGAALVARSPPAPAAAPLLLEEPAPPQP